MIRIINLVIPFLLEMLFGKKDDKVVLTDSQVWKRRIVYCVMFLSFGLNYLETNRLYHLTKSHIALKKDKLVLEQKTDQLEAAQAKADQLEKSLEFCMKVAFRSNPEEAASKLKLNKKLKKNDKDKQG